VVGATNNPAVIDPAILRSGRLETHIEVPLPDTADLVGIFRHHLKGDLAAVVDSAPEPQLPRSAQEGAELDVPSDAKTSTGEVANAAEPCR
jgi:SpoVK/Ycf46/Vps4 family AAA+-type ATPase